MREATPPVEPGRATVLDEAVLKRTWLAPGAASLIALCRCPASTLWSQVSHDPGMVLLLARQLPDARTARFALAGAAEQPALLDDILAHLRQPQAGAVDWHEEPARTVLAASHACAHLASAIALRSGLGAAESAWMCGVLAPLGWFLLCAADPEAVKDAMAVRRPLTALPSLARRWARALGLPDWLAAMSGFLALPEPVARALGADPVLFHITRIAVHLAQENGHDLSLLPAARGRESIEALSLAPDFLSGDWVGAAAQQAHRQPWQWHNPYDQALLCDLLAVAGDNRRLRAAPRLHRLEREIDHLRLALEDQVDGEAERLHTAKLEALAEFAAGAGHEINNPLAVVSGQAQYLLGHENEWFAADARPHVRKALEAIIAQARRMHGLLRDLMQFARPAAPNLGWFDLPTLLGEVAASLHELALQRHVRLEVESPLDRFSVHVDAGQVRQVLGCLLRNAIEAAPHEGWARLVLRRPLPGKDIEVAIEDNGPGPHAEQRPHLFDPFYSGRSSGRGRGLGLPIAWRLARLHGGGVYLEPPAANQPTRFLLRLPSTAQETQETAPVRLAS